jgi:hypothetical protein
MVKRKMSENSLKNLEKGNLANKTPAERKEIARRGAATTNAKIAERKSLAELMKVALRLQNVETGEVNEIAITNALINKAIKGDVSAYQTIRDTIGEKPTDKQEITTNQPAVNLTINKADIKEIANDINDLADE